MANQKTHWCKECGQSYRGDECPHCEAKEKEKEKEAFLNKFKGLSTEEKVEVLIEMAFEFKKNNKKTPVFRRTPKY